MNKNFFMFAAFKNFMQLIDTHTHIFLPEFDNDREEVIKNARENGVEKLLLPNVDSSTSEGSV